MLFVILRGFPYDSGQCSVYRLLLCVVGVRVQLPQSFVGQDVCRTAVGMRAGRLPYYQWELQAFIWVIQGVLLDLGL